MATRTFDAVVIGAGPGGYVARHPARAARQEDGARRKEALGGVCLNWGCIPSKALIAAANLVEDLRARRRDRASRRRASRSTSRSCAQFKDGMVKKLVGGVGHCSRRATASRCSKGTRHVRRPNAVEVRARTAATRVEAASASSIATGSRAIAAPRLQVRRQGRLERQGGGRPRPRSRSGWWSSAAASSGSSSAPCTRSSASKLTVVEALPTIALRRRSARRCGSCRRACEQRRSSVHVRRQGEGPRAEGRRARACTIEVRSGKQTHRPATRCLVAVGLPAQQRGDRARRRRREGRAKGFVAVNDRMQTNVPAIYCHRRRRGPPLLAHKATKEGEIAAEVIAGKKSARDWVAMPAGIFTDPEIATVGLSEERGARERATIPSWASSPSPRSAAPSPSTQTEGFVKVVADARLEAHARRAPSSGPEASDLIAEAALALEMGAYLEDVALHRSTRTRPCPRPSWRPARPRSARRSTPSTARSGRGRQPRAEPPRRRDAVAASFRWHPPVGAGLVALPRPVRRVSSPLTTRRAGARPSPPRQRDHENIAGPQAREGGVRGRAAADGPGRRRGPRWHTARHGLPLPAWSTRPFSPSDAAPLNATSWPRPTGWRSRGSRSTRPIAAVTSRTMGPARPSPTRCSTSRLAPTSASTWARWRRR